MRTPKLPKSIAVVFTAITLGGVFAYIAAPASDVNRPRSADRPAFTIPPAGKPTWEPDFPVDSPRVTPYSGIENDLDGNASALRSADARGPLQ